MRRIILFVLTVNLSFAASNPIIFVHGQRGGKNDDAKPEKCWPDWNGEKTEPPWKYKNCYE